MSISVRFANQLDPSRRVAGNCESRSRFANHQLNQFLTRMTTCIIAVPLDGPSFGEPRSSRWAHSLRQPSLSSGDQGSSSPGSLYPSDGESGLNLPNPLFTSCSRLGLLATTFLFVTYLHLNKRILCTDHISCCNWSNPQQCGEGSAAQAVGATVLSLRHRKERTQLGSRTSLAKT